MALTRSTTTRRATMHPIHSSENGTVLIHQLKDMDRINITVRHFLCNHPFTFEWDNRWWYGEGKNVLVNEYDEDGRYVPVSEWWHDTEQLYRWTAPNYTMPVDALEDTDGDDGEARIVKPTQGTREAQDKAPTSTSTTSVIDSTFASCGIFCISEWIYLARYQIEVECLRPYSLSPILSSLSLS